MTGEGGTRVRHLHHLARLYRVQTAYTDAATRRRRQASPEALLAVLRVLGAPVGTLRDVPAALRERRQALWQRCCEPVVVAWDGRRVAPSCACPRTWPAGLQLATSKWKPAMIDAGRATCPASARKGWWRRRASGTSRRASACPAGYRGGIIG